MRTTKFDQAIVHRAADNVAMAHLEKQRISTAGIAGWIVTATLAATMTLIIVKGQMDHRSLKVQLDADCQQQQAALQGDIGQVRAKIAGVNAALKKLPVIPVEQKREVARKRYRLKILERQEEQLKVTEQMLNDHFKKAREQLQLPYNSLDAMVADHRRLSRKNNGTDRTAWGKGPEPATKVQ